MITVIYVLKLTTHFTRDIPLDITIFYLSYWYRNVITRIQSFLLPIGFGVYDDLDKDSDADLDTDSVTDSDKDSHKDSDKDSVRDSVTDSDKDSDPNSVTDSDTTEEP